LLQAESNQNDSEDEVVYLTSLKENQTKYKRVSTANPLNRKSAIDVGKKRESLFFILDW